MTNEKRLICLEDAKEALIGWDTDPTDEEIEYTLDGLPRVDAVEVVHARWENIRNFGSGNCFGYCSNCKTPQKAADATALKYGHKFCHWCGAKMDGGNDQ